jgi:proline iminopeptidase
VILYDHRCNGRSIGGDVSGITWENLTADAEALREALGIKQWAVLGHSFGGFVALEYSIRYPQSLSHLILLDTGGDARMVQNNAEKVLEKKHHNKLVIETAHRLFNGQIAKNELTKCMIILGKVYYSSSNILFLLREAFHGIGIHRNAEACIQGFGKLLPGWSVMNQLKEINVPTLLLAGRDDFQFPPEHQRLMSEKIANSQVKIIDNAGHNAQIEKPQEVMGILMKFIKNQNA